MNLGQGVCCLQSDMVGEGAVYRVIWCGRKVAVYRVIWWGKGAVYRVIWWGKGLYTV